MATRDAKERGGKKKGITCMSKVNSNREETAVKYSTVITEDPVRRHAGAWKTGKACISKA